MLEISAVTARRYVMGRGGLWPGRRWRGLEGAGTAMRAMADLQLDPLVVVARAHDLMLHSRVVDYTIDDWAILTYERREFFDWGGWLAVRPMDETPTRYHVSLDVADRPGVLAAVAHAFAEHDVSISTVRQDGSDDAATLVIVTHSAPDAALAATVAALRDMDIVRGVTSVLRVEGLQ